MMSFSKESLVSTSSDLSLHGWKVVLIVGFRVRGIKSLRLEVEAPDKMSLLTFSRTIGTLIVLVHVMDKYMCREGLGGCKPMKTI